MLDACRFYFRRPSSNRLNRTTVRTVSSRGYCAHKSSTGQERLSHLTRPNVQALAEADEGARIVKELKESSTLSPLRIVIVVVPPVKALDVFGPVDVFGNVNALRYGRREYEVTIISATADRIVASHTGSPVYTDDCFHEVRQPIDTLLITGSVAPSDLEYESGLLGWLKDQSSRCRRIASVGSGAFVLAKAGLLDGRRVTTHWKWADELAYSYPRVSVDPNPIFVRDHNFYTSAGVTAGIDLCLALVEDDVGKSIALAVARMMLVFMRRAADQPQCSATLAAQAGVIDSLDHLLAWLPDNLSNDLSIEVLALRVAMSPRNFARVFRSEVGKTPGRHIEDLRLESARRQLESSRLSIEEVASASGFSSAEVLRRAFGRRFGITPGQYRVTSTQGSLN